MLAIAPRASSRPRLHRIELRPRHTAARAPPWISILAVCVAAATTHTHTHALAADASTPYEEAEWCLPEEDRAPNTKRVKLHTRLHGGMGDIRLHLSATALAGETTTAARTPCVPWCLVHPNHIHQPEPKASGVPRAPFGAQGVPCGANRPFIGHGHPWEGVV